MSTAVTVFTVLATAGTAAVGWYLWSGLRRTAGAPVVPSAPEAPRAEPERLSAVDGPDLDDPRVAAADALARRWFTERMGGPRGLDKAARERRVAELAEVRGLSPGLAAATVYAEFCRERRMTPKRPPAEVRAALETLGARRGGAVGAGPPG